MKNFLKIFSLMAIVFFGILFFYQIADVFAISQDTTAQLKAAAETGAGYDSNPTSLTSMIAKIIRVFLSLLGIIFLILTLYAGFLWMTAGGNDEKVGQAKKTLTSAVIGLIIVTGSYSISLFAERIATGTQDDKNEVRCVELESGTCCYGDPCWTW